MRKLHPLFLSSKYYLFSTCECVKRLRVEGEDHTSSVEELMASLCEENGMNYFNGTWNLS